MSTEKYIDLIGVINTAVRGQSGTVVQFGSTSDLDRREVLRWLDNHPEHVPGRTAKPTVTVSEVTDEAGTDHADLVIRCIEYMDLATVVPDEETTNAGHDRDWWIENANVNDAEDCEACEGDLCPVHHGMAVGIDLMARKMAALGDDPELFALIPDPVKAPGGASCGCGCGDENHE